MIARNEEAFISYALESIKPIADQIVVVDTGSTDRTIQIAKRHDAQVIRYKWQDDFSKARNLSLRYAKCDWILVLDADESIAPKDLPKLKKLLNSKTYQAYRMPRRNYVDNLLYMPNIFKHDFNNGGLPNLKTPVGYHKTKLIRLFRNNLGIRFQGKVHEIVDDAVRRLGIKTKEIDIPIHHLGHLRPRKTALKKQINYINISSEEKRKRPLLSLCMMVKNEERFLEKSILSVRPIVDEIIIVDTGSTDRTAEIARSLGARVYNYKWREDHPEARNHSISLAKGEWILYLDADEVISKKDLPKIKKLLNSKRCSAFRFPIRTYVNNLIKLPGVTKGGRGYEEGKGFFGFSTTSGVRLFKNGLGIKFEHLGHDSVDSSIHKLDLKVKNTNISIHHFKFLKGSGIFETNQKMYSRLAAKEYGGSDNPKSRYNFGLSFYKYDMPERALKHFKKAEKLYPHPHIYFCLAKCYTRMKKDSVANLLFGKAAELYLKNFIPSYLVNLNLIKRKRSKKEICKSYKAMMTTLSDMETVYDELI
jgi:glycosyltransferase involved in cell wall biosynthesis